MIREEHNTLTRMELSTNETQQCETRFRNFSQTAFVSMGKFHEFIRAREVMLVQTASSIHHDDPHMNVKLPDYTLLEFDGSLANWLHWRDTFDSLIHKNEKLSKIVKYHYLRAAIKLPLGELNVLNNFTLCENSYDEAWRALRERYDDERKLKSRLLTMLNT
jgi:Protein of unknown function (DUF1759)